MLEALFAAARRAGTRCFRTERYEGVADWLVLFGVGHAERAPARTAHVQSGRHAILWDLGYFGRKKLEGYCRTSIDADHPQAWLDKTPNDASRWNAHSIALQEDYDPKGHIVLVGLGYKSRVYLGLTNWEQTKLAELRQRFPDRKIIYRPKPRRPSPKHSWPKLDCSTDSTSPIRTLLDGASLVVCRHSNVAIDATIAGIPFESEDGAAMWLLQRPFTPENRLTFLHKLSWWQYRQEEAEKAWIFLTDILEVA